MIPKPNFKKQRIKKEKCLFNRGECYSCGSTRNLQKHHIFGAANRPLSEQYGIYLDLCFNCHLSVTDEKNERLCEKLKKEGQRRFEEIHGHEKFVQVFKINYL